MAMDALMKVAKPKGEPDGDEAEMDDDEGGSAEYAKAAVEAAQDGDAEGFAAAMRGFIKCCS